MDTTLAKTQDELTQAKAAAQKEKKFQEEVKKGLEKELAVLKKKNDDHEQKLTAEVNKIKDEYTKKIELVKKSAEDEKDRAVSAAAYRRKREVEK